MLNSGGQASTRQNGLEYGLETLFGKYKAAPGLVLTTLLTILLLIGESTRWRSSVAFSHFVQRERSATAIVVQLISAILGAIQVYALCTIFNLSFRLHSAQSSYSLGTWNFATAIVGKQFIFSLPWRRLLVLCIFLAITLSPAALWAGALTPNGATTTKQCDIGVATQATYWLPGDDLPTLPNSGNVSMLSNTKGIFSFRPEFDIQGALLASASTASAIEGASNLHTKLDKTGFSYLGRSYGVGASAGLADYTIPDFVTNYTYYEAGFLTNVSCIYNATADISFNDVSAQLKQMGWLVDVMDLVGQLPDGTSIEVAAATIYPHAVVLWWASEQSGPELYIGIAVSRLDDNAHGDIASLNNIQCSVVYNPTNFSVLVDIVNKTIAVTPLEGTEWPIGGQNLTIHTLRTLNWISSSAGSGFYQSVTGVPLANNAASLINAQGYGSGNVTVLEAVADSFLNLIDNTFVAFASAKIMISNDTAFTTVTASLPAETFGSWRYIIPVAILNGIIVLIYLVEALRTRGWRGLSKFDFMDLPSVIISASAGGTELAQAARDLDNGRGKTDDIEELIYDLRIQRMGNSEFAKKVIRLADAETIHLEEPERSSYNTPASLRRGNAGYAEIIPLADVEEGRGGR